MIIKIMALGIIGTLISLFLKKYNKELLPFFEIAIVIGAFFLIVETISPQLEKLSSFIKVYSHGEEIFTYILKGAVVTVVSKLVSEICRESGNSLVGEIVELGGRTMLIVLSMPFIIKVAQTAMSFAS